MTTLPIAPYQPHLRTLSLCHPWYNGQHIEYHTSTGEIHLTLQGRNPAKDVIDALAKFHDRPIWMELVHCKRDDNTQLSATFWSMESLLVDVTNPTPSVIEEVLADIGASEVAQVAIAAAFAGKDAIIYFDQGWKYYVTPVTEESSTEEAA